MDTRRDMICRECDANFGSRWASVPDNGDVICRDCPSCGGIGNLLPADFEIKRGKILT